MSLDGFLIGAGALALSILSFLFGKVFSQSENILDKKRDAYRSFLRVCPAPNEAHFAEFELGAEMQREMGILSLYASPDAVKFAAQYFSAFADAQVTLIGIEEPGHPEFLRLMTSYNRMIWAMRNDAMTWSIFAPSRRSREYQPSIELEAKR